MPERELRQAMASGLSRYELSDHFGVSVAARAYRMQLLGLG